jgi:NitT/TauT family transport system substrate-binding protein
MKSTLSQGRRISWSSAVVVTLAWAVLATAMLPGPGHTQTLMVVRAGKITGDMSVFPVVFGSEQGIYRRAGLDLKLIDFGGGADAIRGLLAGDTDTFITTMFSTLTLVKSRGRADITATFQLSDHPIFLLVVKADSRVRTVADLKGGKIGITTFGSGSDFLARAMLVKAGLKADEDVTLVQARSIPAAVAGVEKGDLDAAVAWHPLAAEGASRGTLRVLAAAKDDAPGLEPTTPAFRDEFVQRNGPAAKRFIQATLESIRQIRRDRAAAVREAVRIHQIPEPIARTTIDYYASGVWTQDGRFNEKGLIDTQLWLIRIAQIERIVPLNTLIRKDLLP